MTKEVKVETWSSQPFHPAGGLQHIPVIPSPPSSAALLLKSLVLVVLLAVPAWVRLQGIVLSHSTVIGAKPLMYLVTKTDRPGHNFSFLVFFFFSCRFIYQGPVISNICVQRGMSKIREERRRRRSLVCRISGNVNFWGVAFCWEEVFWGGGGGLQGPAEEHRLGNHRAHCS